MEIKSKSRFDTRTLVLTSVLIALIAVMTFTSLGYIRTGILSITLLPVPVVVGAILLGPSVGALLGFVFGLTSLLQCFGLEAFGTALFSINPTYTVLLCFVPRILMGWLAGLIFRALSAKKTQPPLYAFLITSVSGALLNTVLFMTGLFLLFGQTEYIQAMQGGMTVFAYLWAAVALNACVEAGACLLLGSVISRALYRFVRYGR